MTILRKYIEPAFEGKTIPGTPPTPGYPAHCIDTVIHHAQGETVVFIEKNGILTPISVSTGPYDEIVTECYPATTGTPGTPDIKIPARTARFFLGWNAAADSVASLPGSGQYRFTVATDAVGIVTGFTPAPAGVGYANITHGLYFNNGSYQFIESGFLKAFTHAFADTDVFIIQRLASGQVLYVRNGALVLTSLYLSTGTVWADASEYFGGDEITDAALEPLSVVFVPGTGTDDPPAPPVPPPGYEPGHGPVPPPPPGGVLPYTVCNGTLRTLTVWASDTTPNGVQPGPGPDPFEPPDPTTGDWPGRVGGDLRMLVVRAEGQGYGNWNGGTVEPGTEPPTEPDPDGDWPGRAGGQWRQLVGEGFAYSGSDSHYSFLEGTLADLTSDSGATTDEVGDLLIPQYALLDGYLQPLAGYSVVIVGQCGNCYGSVGNLTCFATNLEGGFVGSDGPPPFDPGDIVPTPGVTTVHFDDPFNGAGDLTTHPPVLGGGYTNGDGDSLADYVLDEAGNLIGTDTDALPTSAIDGTLGDTFLLSEVLTTTSGDSPVVITLGLGSEGELLYEMVLTYDDITETWSLTVTVHDGDGTVVFTDTDDVTAAMTDGEHTISISVSPAGVDFVIDGDVISTTTDLSDTLPDAVTFGVDVDPGTSAVTVTEILLTSESVFVPGWEPDATGDWPGRMGGQLRMLVGRSYEMSAFATGGAFDATHSGHYLLFAFGHSPTIANDPVTGFPVGYGFYGLHSGSWTLEANTGSYFNVTGPAGTLEGTGAAAILGDFLAEGPAGTLDIAGVCTIVGSFAAEHAGAYELSAGSGGYFDVTGPHGVLGSSTGSGDAVGVAGIAASFNVTGGSGVLEITGLIAGGFGVFDVIGPALQPVYGELFSIGPHGILVAGGAPVLPATVAETDTEGYSITLLEEGETFAVAVSRYTQYPFERIVRYGSTYYGITPDGIFQIGGDTFGTQKIVATVSHPPYDFSTRLGRSANQAEAKIKTARSIMLTGHVPASVQITVAVDDDGSTASGYAYTPEPTDTARNHRIDVGRGLEGRYIAMSLTNPDGKDFTLEEISAEFDVSKQRNVWRR